MSTNIKLILFVTIGLIVVIITSTLYLKNSASDLIPAVMDNKASISPSSLWFKKPPNPDNVRCTADVMQCPNGSYVGRVAPSCSFAPCPSGSK